MNPQTQRGSIISYRTFHFKHGMNNAREDERQDPPHRRLGVREERVIQTDYCFMKSRPEDDFITTPVGVDDSFGRCVAICARDVLGVKALAALRGHWVTSDNTERWRALNC